MNCMSFARRLALAVGLATIIPLGGPVLAQAIETPKTFVNSLGMEMIRIEPGTFQMGESNLTTPSLGGISYLRQGDVDESTLHPVTLTQPFSMAATEVTIEQFRQFRPDFKGDATFSPYASGISWNDAVAFCAWLSQKENRHYRLPTEAEWEYACRAGTKTIFSSGITPPAAETPNPWGLKNMHTGVGEWCLDWYGYYPTEKQTDPVGPAAGIDRVLRGVCLDALEGSDAFYRRSANRASLAPDFPPPGLREAQRKVEASEANLPQPAEQPAADGDDAGPVAHPELTAGNAPVGLRLVLAPDPKTSPLPYEVPFIQQFVQQQAALPGVGPDPTKPYYRKYHLLPTPPDESMDPTIIADAMNAAGLPPIMMRHNHSQGLVACPNGDLLAAYFTSVGEYTPDVAQIASRLRYGSDEWEMPNLFVDMADTNDESPMMWNDNGTLWHTWGNPRLIGAFRFNWRTSTDNGATWTLPQFPVFTSHIGPFDRAQPITSGFRGPDNTIYIACDAKGSTSVLWASKDDGRTWFDTGGRTGGRHTAYVVLKDGSFLGLGGKNSNIDGFMPQSLSTDNGKSWTVTKSIFPALGGNQRPALIRLASGRLFMAGDYQSTTGAQPEGYTERGSYAALSDDEGKTWRLKTLPGTLPHTTPLRAQAMQGGTVGYVVAQQSPDGLIHLITSKNTPCLSFALNEAWILSPDKGTPAEEQLVASKATKIVEPKKFEEKYPDGKIKGVWGGGVADDGRFLRDGKETWYAPDGEKRYEVTWKLGRKVGTETHWSVEGKMDWRWEHRPDGTAVKTMWWANGTKREQSTWRDREKTLQGMATCWNPQGKVVLEMDFRDGFFQD